MSTAQHQVKCESAELNNMMAKIITGLSTLGLNLAAGVLILFTMLMAMNGYSEGDAEWGLGTFIILGALISIAMTAGSVILVHFLAKRHYSAVVSV